ncbi:fumarate hydratase [Desulfobaculum bizertense]|uniref:Fumarase, class I alpha subunit n=1 Tax=Desulfobaculum bizertense DSM 18034 TaxID=1121442 RepID=A0A1T4WCQ2_9BACT|nr:fumarate hydratase [Desulfobaculum bizertense]UIJ37448.1 fumarate hydratase [Desulfobaculum bizertense]SKA74798.1 fumarase, class I alpha subunit [Desulfobaculum bizertense DSM 18034]
MRVIEASQIHDAVVDLVLNAARYLPEDVEEALKTARDKEDSDSAREVLGQLLENAELARNSGLPLCQDTGVGVFYVELGSDVHVNGNLEEIINGGMIEGYDKGLLRKSLCDPLTRKNTGDNSPAVVHIKIVPGDKLHIRHMAKGGGSENMSRCTMLTPAQGWEGIKDFVLRRMAEAGPNPCPPTIVGVGIGGTFDMAPALAKEALFRPLAQENPDPQLAKMEEELLTELNKLGVGPMGLGGKTTCLGVKIEMRPCHIASLPLAVNVQCHSSRIKEVVL